MVTIVVVIDYNLLREPSIASNLVAIVRTLGISQSGF